MSQSSVRNRLLAALAPDDYAYISPLLERVPLKFHSVLIEGNEPIQHVIFPESGVVSAIADTGEGRIEVGLIGKDGLVGLPVVLGTSQSPTSFIVQADGEAIRVTALGLRSALEARPSISRVLGRYAQFMIVQVSQTAYVNTTFDLQARLARWLLMMQDRTDGDELFFTHDFLSAMLGVRRPGVTIATHVLEGSGAIRAKRGRIQVRDREKLMELAGSGYQSLEREYERLMAEA